MEESSTTKQIGSSECGHDNRRRLCLVQFSHPWREYPAGKDIKNGGKCAWNCKEHYRRFIHHNGDYVDKNGNRMNAELAFWGEWEAETRVETTGVNGNECARFVHTVLYPDAPTGAVKSNCGCTISCSCPGGFRDTDPCIFGKTFKYSNCRQRSNGVMRHLQQGSLILFGAIHKGTFYLDTVFVVGTSQDYETDGKLPVSNIECSSEYHTLTLNRLRNGEFTFYRGVCFRKGKDSPYSFVPARLWKLGTQTCTKRCILEKRFLDGLNTLYSGAKKAFNLKASQNFCYAPIDEKSIQKVWQKIKKEVERQGFVLGIRFPWPPKRPKETSKGE